MSDDDCTFEVRETSGGYVVYEGGEALSIAFATRAEADGWMWIP
jgi:hypothetical protein